MAAPNLCTVTGNVRNLLGQAVQNCTVSVSVVTPFIYPATGSFIAGQLGSVSTSSTGDFSIAVVETQTAGSQVKFTFTYSDGVSTNKSKSYTVPVPNISSSTFQNLLTITTLPTTLPTFPATQVTVVAENGISSTNAQAALEEVYADQSAVAASLATHVANVANPHVVTAAQVGLGNVDNTSDASKPVSTAQQAALDLKAPIASPTFTGTVTAPTFSGALSGNATTATTATSATTATTATSFSGSLTGDVGGTQGATAIGNNKVTNAMLAQIATATFKGRTTASTGNVEDLTATQATALLNVVVGDSGSGGTKGLVPAAASGDAAANKFLKASGAWATTPSASTVTVVSKSANYTVTSADDVVLSNANSAAFTLTLPAAASNSGKVLRVVKTDSTFNAVTLDGNASETINGALTRTLNTQYETITIVCDGSNWTIIQKDSSTGWISYTPTFGAGFGTVSGVSMFWRRVGDSIELMGNWANGTVAASAATITPPSGLAFDANKLAVAATAGGTIVGYNQSFTSTNLALGWANSGASVFYDGTDTAKLYFSGSTGSNVIAKTNANGFAVSSLFNTLHATVPVSGWNA